MGLKQFYFVVGPQDGNVHIRVIFALITRKRCRLLHREINILRCGRASGMHLERGVCGKGGANMANGGGWGVVQHTYNNVVGWIVNRLLLIVLSYRSAKKFAGSFFLCTFALSYASPMSSDGIRGRDAARHIKDVVDSVYLRLSESRKFKAIRTVKAVAIVHVLYKYGLHICGRGHRCCLSSDSGHARALIAG